METGKASGLVTGDYFVVPRGIDSIAKAPAMSMNGEGKVRKSGKSSHATVLHELCFLRGNLLGYWIPPVKMLCTAAGK